MGCSNTTPDPQKDAIAFIIANTPELSSIKNIDTIITFPADSFYIPLSHTARFKEFDSTMNKNYYNLLKEIDDYKQFERLFGETPVNGGLVDLYQNFVRYDIEELKELKSVYKPTYLGIRIPVYIEYTTSFKDSIYVFDAIMNDDLDSLIDIYGYGNGAKDDFIYDTEKQIGDFIWDEIIKIRGYINDSIYEPDTSVFIKPILIE